MPQKIWVVDLKHPRPWLNIENGELVKHISIYFPQHEILHCHQVDTNSKIFANNKNLSSPSIFIINVNYYTINVGRSVLKKIENNPQIKIIIYGYGIHFLSVTDKITIDICYIDGYDLSKVINQISHFLNISSVNENLLLPFINSDYSRLPIDTIFNYPIRASKGCFNSCTFCINCLNGNIIFKEKEILEKEVEQAIRKYRTQALTYWDSALNASEKQIDNVCKIAKKFSIPWRSNGMTIRQLTEKMIRKMAQSGCYLISLGIESLDPDVQTGKRLNAKEVRQVTSLLKKYGIYSVGFFIIGLEGDTLYKALKNIEQAHTIGLDILVFASAIAYPGTKLENYVRTNGTFLYDFKVKTPNEKYLIHFETEGFTRQQREIAINESRKFDEKNNLIKKELEAMIGGPSGPSHSENIKWIKH